MCEWITTATLSTPPDEIEAKLYNHFSIHSPVDWLTYVEKVRSEAIRQADASAEKLALIKLITSLPDTDSFWHLLMSEAKRKIPMQTRKMEPSSFTCDYGFPNCTHPVEAPDVCPNYEAMTSELVPPPDEGRM